VTETPEAAAACASCGAEAADRFCPRCGERRLGPADFSLRSFASEAVGTLTSVDSNLFRSFAFLIAQPGLLTVEYLEGRRVRYLRPLQLFVFANVLYFFLQPALGLVTLNTDLQSHYRLLYGPLVRTLTERAAALKHISVAEYALVFNATIATHARALVITMVPMFALFLQALYWRSRSSYLRHLVFALHFYAFFLLFLPVWWLAMQLRAPASQLIGPVVFATEVEIGVLFSGFAAYLYPALGRVYRQGRWASGAKSLGLLVAVLAVLEAYRYLLFLTAWLTV
jgi:hypothetical protein